MQHAEAMDQLRSWANRWKQWVGPDGDECRYKNMATAAELGADAIAERDQLAAHVERLREKSFKMRAAISGAWSADRMTSVADSLRPVIQDPECDREPLAATPAQSLAAHDAALLREVADEIDSPYTHDGAAAIRREAYRIEKEAANGQA